MYVYIISLPIKFRIEVLKICIKNYLYWNRRPNFPAAASVIKPSYEHPQELDTPRE